MTTKKPIRVLIVDDSAVVRAMLRNLLARDDGIEVCATATDPFDARDKVVSLCPDVITLDVQMPRMDGLTFLDKIMTGRPTPVIMCSALTTDGAEITMRALERGAVDVVAKPMAGTPQALNDLAIELAGKIKAAAQIKDIKRHYLRQKGAWRLREKVPALRREPPPVRAAMTLARTWGCILPCFKAWGRRKA